MFGKLFSPAHSNANGSGTATSAFGKMMYEPLLISSLIAHAERYHADTEVVSVETDQSVRRTTWGEIAVNARRLASALSALGVEPGARCGTIAWNNARHLEIYFGVSGGGYVCHTLNPRLAPEHLIHIVNDAADTVLFIDETFAPAVAKLVDKFPSLKHVVLMGPRKDSVAEMIDGVLFYDELIATGDEAYQWPQFDENSPSSLCYTSGTTGMPKGVQYTHRSSVLHSIAGNQPDGLALSAKDCAMPVVPMFHVNAWGVPYIAAACGCKLVLPGPALDGESLAKLIDAEQVTISLGVPTIWMGLLAGLEKTGVKAESMTRTVVGGSALPPSMAQIFRDKYDIELIHAWGMTETSPLGTLNQLLQKHIELPAEQQAERRVCQGRPPFGVELRIVDDSLQPLAEDGQTSGALQIRGHWIVDTYFGSSESALTPDGWFDTGDVATIDPNGYMTIVDRTKDIIKSGGEWISTVELENIAIAHPAIANAAAIAARHPKWDERPVIVAVKAPDAEVGEEEVLAFYKDKVPSWQVPDRVVFAEALPLGATGKVQKHQLREQFGDILLAEGA